ncbi:MAG: hypothetical protein TUN42_04300 [Dehalogenimonas sp.]
MPTKAQTASNKVSKLQLLKTPEEIKAKVDAFFSNTTFLDLKKKMESHYDLYRLKPFVPETGYLAYTSNEPRNQFDKLIALGVNAKLRINILDSGFTAPMATAAEKMEQFLYGVLDWNDQKFLQMGLPSVRQQMFFWSGLQGGFFHRTFVFKDTEGVTRADSVFWPRHETAYSQGSKGLIWAAHKYQVTYERAQDEWGFVKEGTPADKMIDVIDWWDTQNNGVLLDGTTWGKPLTAHGLDYCPVFRLCVGSCPVLAMANDTLSANNQGQSIFETTANLATSRNRLYSDMLTLVHRAVKQPLVTETHEGESILNGDAMQVSKTAEIPVKLGEKIYPLMPNTMPPDTAALLGIINGENEKGGFSPLSWGQTQRALSGYATNLLQSADGSILMPYLTAVGQAYQTICVTIIKQFGNGSFPGIKVKGRDSKGQQFGYPKPIEIKPADIDPDWIPEVTLEAVFPRDDAQKVQIASILKQSRLMSDRSIQTKTLGVDDPEAERRQMVKEVGYNLQTVQLWLAYIAAVDSEDYDLAANILVEARKATQLPGPPMEQANAAAGGALNMPPSPLPNQAFSPLKQMALEQGGGIPPNGMNGMDNSVLPPEAMGGPPGGAVPLAGGI